MSNSILVVFLCTLGSIASASSIPTQNLGTKKFTTFALSQNADLWFFNGAMPSNYAVTVPLVAAGPQLGNFSWQVTANPNAVRFENDANAISKQNSGTVQLKSSEISLNPDDVHISFSYNGALLGVYKTSVFAPQRVVRIGEIDHRAASDSLGSGYQSQAVYTVLDHFGNVIPSPLEMNEKFVSELRADDEPNVGWAIPVEIGETNTFITDTYSQLSRLQKFPSPIAPLDPPGIRRIFTVPQKYFAGSLDAGVGRQMRFHTVEWFQDHAFVPVTGQ